MRPATLCTTLYQDHINSDFHRYLLYLIISFVDICVLWGPIVSSIQTTLEEARPNI